MDYSEKRLIKNIRDATEKGFSSDEISKEVASLGFDPAKYMYYSDDAKIKARADEALSAGISTDIISQKLQSLGLDPSLYLQGSTQPPVDPTIPTDVPTTAPQPAEMGPASSKLGDIVKTAIQPIQKAVSGTGKAVEDITYSPAGAALAHELVGAERAITRELTPAAALLDLIPGVDTGPEGGFKELLEQTPPLKEQEKKIDIGTAQSFGSVLSMIPEVGALSLAVERLAPGVVKGVSPAIQSMVKSMVTGAGFGTLEQPTEGRTRIQNINDSMLYFAVFTGVAEGIGKAVNLLEGGKYRAYQSMRQEVIKNLTETKNVMPEYAEQVADLGINAAVGRKGGWDKVLRKDIKDWAKKAQKRPEKPPEPRRDVTPKPEEVKPEPAPEQPKPEITPKQTLIAKEVQQDGSVIPIYKAAEAPKPAVSTPKVPPKATEPDLMKLTPERESEVKAIVEKHGGKYIGLRESMPAEGEYPAEPLAVEFNDSKGSTKSIPIDKFSEQTVKERLAKPTTQEDPLIAEPIEKPKGKVLPETYKKEFDRYGYDLKKIKDDISDFMYGRRWPIMKEGTIIGWKGHKTISPDWYSPKMGHPNHIKKAVADIEAGNPISPVMFDRIKNIIADLRSDRINETLNLRDEMRAERKIKHPTDETITAKETEILKAIAPEKTALQDFLLKQDGSAKLRKVITEGMKKGLSDKQITDQVREILPKEEKVPDWVTEGLPSASQKKIKQSESDLLKKLPKKELPAGLSIESVPETPKDNILLPEGANIEFANKELESRWKSAKGIKGISIWEKAKIYAKHIKNTMIRTYSEIPKDAKHSEFLQILERQKINKIVVKENALRLIQNITSDLGKKQYDLFTRKVVLDDLIFDMKQGKDLPLGLTPELLQAEKTNIDTIVDKNPSIKEAISRRKSMQDSILQDLVKHKIINSEQAQNPNYFHHQVLDIANAKKHFGSSQTLKKTKPGIAHIRKGTELDINTDYLEAEFDYITQALQSIKTLENLKRLEQSKYNIKKQLVDKVKQFKKSDDDTWRKHIPEGYAIWQAKEGSVFYKQKTIAESSFQKLVEGVLPENLAKEMVFVGGKRAEMVLPENIVRTLNQLNVTAPKTDTEIAFDLVTKVPIQLWKRWVLFNPVRVLKYNYQNTLGDLDAVLSANPGSLKYLLRGFMELYQHFYGKKPMTPDMKNFFERGGLTSGITINELLELRESSIFAKLYDKKPLGEKLNVVKQWFRSSGKASTFRENLLRYTLYLDYLERFRTNKPGSHWVLKYGASNSKVIDSLPSPEDKAAKVATEVLGDYGNISEFGKMMRERVSPFFSWLEINFKRYPKFIKNAIEQGVEKDVKKRLIAGSAVKVTSSVLTWAVRATALWTAFQTFNQLRDPEAEKDLSEYDRRRMHLQLGRDKEGNPTILRGQGALSDYFEWFGLNELPTLVRLLASGKIDMPYLMTEMAKAPVNKAFSSISPLYKATMEYVAGVSFFPDVFEPRATRDRTRQILQNVQMENLYDYLSGKPTVSLSKIALSATPIVTKDVKENAYGNIQNLKRLFLKKLGKGNFSVSYFSQRSQAVYYYKKAIKLGDKKAEAKYLKEIKELGISKGDLGEAIKRLSPLSGLTVKEKGEFVHKFLNKEDKRKFQLAMEYYEELMGGIRKSLK